MLRGFASKLEEEGWQTDRQAGRQALPTRQKSPIYSSCEAVNLETLNGHVGALMRKPCIPLLGDLDRMYLHVCACTCPCSSSSFR